jgi:adenine-specific DNA-methyltransferase
MLANGLGTILREKGCRANRFVDLFCGSGVVSWYAAKHLPCPVLAVDLQEFAVVLARAVVARTHCCNPSIMHQWLSTVAESRASSSLWAEAMHLRALDLSTPELVERARQLCADEHSDGPTWSVYGGHYYAPWQALTLDCLLEMMPTEPEERNAALAAVIHAASKCVAAPGHTAQPLQPTETAAPFLLEAWSKDPLDHVDQAIKDICFRHAQKQGSAVVADAQEIAESLTNTDLVFVDPPYSDVQYSRFYHVLETIARGGCGTITGVGRYPPAAERPRSAYSLRSQARDAIYKLLQTLAHRECTVIVTFPRGKASNGLSGDEISQIASEWYKITEYSVASQFSTLGGSENGNRKARQRKIEMILVLQT